jgi:hypothetical protein
VVARSSSSKEARVTTPRDEERSLVAMYTHLGTNTFTLEVRDAGRPELNCPRRLISSPGTVNVPKHAHQTTIQ